MATTTATPLHFERRNDGRWHVHVPHRGHDLLNEPLLNKGTAFTTAERDEFGLHILLPTRSDDIGLQARRAYAQIRRKSDPLERYIGMTALQDNNETLFHRVLLDHPEELMPIVYTPTVGEACRSFSAIFRRSRGAWITPAHRGRIAELLAEVPLPDIRLIVVTDNERILGLGDQGAGGIGIPIGKLALYTMAAGIHPAHTWPVSLDVGTDNEELLDDELYVGWREPRLRGPAYDELVDEFVHAVRGRFPDALLQWEDFKKSNAFDLLDRYRDVLPSFNDDIQGTAAVALAGILATCRAKAEPIADQRVVIAGAGAAGIGIGRLLRDALARAGVAGADLLRAVAILDSGGLLTDDREYSDSYKSEFAWPAALARDVGLAKGAGLREAIEALKPTVLIGTSGQPGVFDEALVRAMASHCERPAIFPFSNPTSKSEAIPADLLAWTDGRALVATGSPFDPVERAGRNHRIGQGNNVYVFPGVGLGALAGGASEVTDSMFTIAAEVLAASVGDDDLAEGALFPRLDRLREITGRIAEAIVRDTGGDPARVEVMRWSPEYPVMTAV